MSSVKRKGDAAAADASKKAKTNGSITSFFKAPKTAAAAAAGATKAGGSGIPFAANDPASVGNLAARFDKEKWVATLTPEQKKHLALEINTMDPSWLALLKDEVVKPEFIALKKFIEGEVRSGQTVFPPSEDVYSWSRHTPFHKVKCVILGQDPYHNHNQAHGLCFSVRPPTPAPPSLKNMYIALKKDYPSFVPPPKSGGLLTPWAERGVLMLNTCLTVRAHAANSHQKRGWEAFTQKVIDLVAQKRTRGVVFLAWGKPAGDRVARVDGKKHLVLKSVHPSPLSASRGFFDCGHFRKANEWLRNRYGDEDGEIDWNLNPDGVPTVSKKVEEEKENKKIDGNEDVDEDEEAAIALAAAEAEAEAETAITPVVAVGKVKASGEEESGVLEKRGEDGNPGEESK
ncbi:uracil-DNA glycosylase [Xylaria bambusicola]|uniref:uracil-DNA glycosylase n=1 Tax=Xylaria bambusicola TaxID=326684 RepID=UPI0020083FAF|nr:uracil-DNA glycosylase [Xylaria bambusicola]KAI0521572.1 uracil-DNA glycosylase [Xylaria bambusicola]